jgi:hypothetical protein
VPKKKKKKKKQIYFTGERLCCKLSLEIAHDENSGQLNEGSWV